MAVKLFNRIGLRRDFNLSDLLSPETALGNILATDSMSGGDPFSVRDLDPIKNIYVTDITAEVFNTLDGIAVEFTQTTIDPTTGLPLIDEDTNPDIYLPLIKIKNRLDTAYFTTGEPFFFGGDGPNAVYYDSENIIVTPDLLVLSRVYEYGDVVRTSQNRVYRAVVTDATTANNLTHTSGVVNGFQYLQDYAFSNGDLILNGVFDSVTGEELTESDNFWERGQFIYGNKVRDTFLSLFGGVNWKGFFKPVTSGRSNFWVRTTGSTVFKFQDPSVPSSTGLSYGRIPSATITSLTTYRNSLAAGSAGRIWVDTLLSILQDTARTFIEVNLDTSINIATDDIAYIEAKKGPVVSKQYKLYTRYLTGQPNNVNQFFIEVTKDFNLKNVSITSVPEVTANNAYFGFFRFYAWERRSQKTYLNSIHHKLELSSGEFTIGTGVNTITFANTALGRFYYYHIMANDYIYDYRSRGSDTNYGVRRFIVTSYDDSTRTITCEIDADYTAVNGSGNNDQQARHTPFSFEGGSTGTAINTTYTTGDLFDTIVAGSPTTNLFFVGRYGEIVPREKFITIEQFLSAYEEFAIDWTYYTKDSDVPNAGQVQEKAWVLWYASETSGFGPLNYKYLYDINYKFFQIGDFKVFLDNSIPYGGTSRETGIEQRAFGGEQLLTPGDQYNLFYSTLPVSSTYVPPVKYADSVYQLTATFANNSRLVTLSTAVDAEVGSYITLRDGRNLYEDYFFPVGTRATETLSANTISNDIVLSKNTLSVGSNTSVLVYNHRGFVTTMFCPYKGDGFSDSTILGWSGDLPTNSCLFPYGTYNLAGTTTTFNSGSAAVTYTANGYEFRFEDTAGGLQITGPGVGQVFYYRTSNDDEIQLGMVFVSIQDQSNQTEYRRVLNIEPGTTANSGQIWFNRPYTLINGDLLSAIYYDRGIDITKPLETYCNNTNCAQNSYSIVTVTDPNTSETSLVTNINTRYVALQVASTNNADLNALWTETLGSGWYRNTQTTGSSTSQWWVDDNQTALTPAPDFTSNANSTRRYKENIVYVRLNSNSGDTAVALEQLGFSNLKNEISASIPFGTIEGALKIYGDGILGTTTNGYKYYFIVKLFTEVNVTTDTETDSNGNVIDKVLNWTEVASSSLNIQRFLHPVVGNEGTTALRSSNITSYSDLNTKYNAFVSSNTNNTTYAQLGNTFTLTAAQAATIFHNPNSIPVDGNGPNRILSIGQYVKYITLNGTRKLLWTRTFDSASFVGFGSSLSTGAMPYTSVTGLSVVDPVGNARIPNLINLQPTYRDIRITGNTPNYDYMQFRGKTYEMVRANSVIEERLPYIRMIHPNSTRSGITQYLQNSTNQRSVYTFAKGSAILSGGAVTFSKELCCPPLDTSPPFDSSPLGLSTTVNEPDMTMGGKINVRSIRATHPVLDIASIPSNVQLANLPVDKKLRVNFGGIFYDMLIGNTDPNNLF